MKRRRPKQTDTLDHRLVEQAKRLRSDARGTIPGAARDKLIRQAQQLEAAAQMQIGWRSPTLRPRGSTMPEYRAYLIGPDGAFFKAIPQICPDDETAKAQAKQLVDGHDIELWQLDRKIGLFQCQSAFKFGRRSPGLGGQYCRPNNTWRNPIC